MGVYNCTILLKVKIKVIIKIQIHILLQAFKSSTRTRNKIYKPSKRSAQIAKTSFQAQKSVLGPMFDGKLILKKPIDNNLLTNK